MNILIPDSWLREFIKTDANPKQIQEALSLCSASVERLHKVNDDYIYDIEVTTNRVDLMSVVGIALEAAAVLPQFGYSAKILSNPLSRLNNVETLESAKYLNVKIDPKLCQRFTTALITNVVVKNSPKKIVDRLEKVGIRSINNVVDVSNYLMHELGQPVHTFDYDKIIGKKMVLRSSKKGEKLTTLDKKSHTLQGGDIVIEDGEGRLIDLCGIMGGINSAVDDKTRNVLLFVQTYSPSNIRKTSMTLAHRTEAAVLFEKGLPVENVLPTLVKGINMLTELTGGKSEKQIIDIIPVKPQLTEIEFSEPLTNFTNERLGVNLTTKQINEILSRLNFKVKSDREVMIPHQRRQDVTIPEDIVEEIARIYGYHNLPSVLMSGSLQISRPDDKTFYWEKRIRDTLKYWGFTETYTYSLISRRQEPNPSALQLKNSLTQDWEYLRTSLTTSHLEVVSQNIGRVDELNLFEIANVYIPQKKGLPKEQLRLIITTTRDANILKGIIDGLFNKEMGIPIGINESKQWLTHSNPTCLTFETELEEIIKHAKTVKSYHPISKYSPIIEDVNVVQKPNQSYADLTNQIKNLSELVSEIKLIDQYKHKLTLRISYHSNIKQLSAQDVAPIREKIEYSFN